MSAACNGVKGAISGVGKFAKDAGKKIGGFFKNLFGRKKRDACSLDAIKLPSLNLDLKGLHIDGPDLSQLLEFAKKLRPDMNFDAFDLNLDNLKSLFQSQSIADIREKLVKVIKHIFEKVQVIFSQCKKFFYFGTLVLLIYDGYK